MLLFAEALCLCRELQVPVACHVSPECTSAFSMPVVGRKVLGVEVAWDSVPVVLPEPPKCYGSKHEPPHLACCILLSDEIQSALETEERSQPIRALPALA